MNDEQNQAELPAPANGRIDVAVAGLGAKRALIVFLAFFGTQIVVGIVIGILGVTWLVLARGTGSPGTMAEAQRLLVMPAAIAGALVSGWVALALTRRSLPGPVGRGALRSIGWAAASSRSMLGAAALIARVNARSLAPAIVLHASYNLVLVISMYAGAGQ